jgi:nitrogen regulatory protein P-II 1
MILLKAIVRPNKLDAVKDALIEIGVTGMTVTEVRGHGLQKGHTAIYRGKEYAVTLLPKLQVEVVLPDHLVDDAAQAVIEAGRTGEIGDGRIFLISFRLLELTGFAQGRQTRCKGERRRRKHRATTRR